MSDISKQIQSAIGMHGLWKARLSHAIDEGSSEFLPEVVRRDTECTFGKWLHGIHDAKTRASPHYKTCLDLHRRFHQSASHILALALAGKAPEAKKEMLPGGEFGKASMELTTAMMAWRQSAS